jgi:outer membrane immunogenic protein
LIVFPKDAIRDCGISSPARHAIANQGPAGELIMKSIAVGLALTALVSVSATAADIAANAPLYKAAPVSSWTGFYAGMEFGGKWADATWTTTSIQPPPIVTANVDASSPAHFRTSDGRRIGGYAGYNWQRERWVYGVEFDGAYAAGTATQMTGIPGCAILCIALAPGPGADSARVRMNWDASARARVGYLVTPDLLAYATVGAAWQSMQTSATCQNSTADPICDSIIGNPFNTQTHTKVLPGWTLGGGLEAKIAENWLLRGEYRFAQFSGHDSITFPAPTAAPVHGPTTLNYRLGVDTQLATVGLAYRFGGL